MNPGVVMKHNDGSLTVVLRLNGPIHEGVNAYDVFYLHDPKGTFEPGELGLLVFRNDSLRNVWHPL